MNIKSSKARTETGKVRRNKLFSLKNMGLYVLFIGIVLRLRQYLFGRSVWRDEAYLLLNITGRTFAKLHLALDYNQSAPLGFLYLEKVFIQLFGSSELSLRALPLLCATAAMILFLKVGRYFFTERVALIAFSLFAVSSNFIYFSAEIKQYSIEVLVTLIIYLIAAIIYFKGIKQGQTFIFGFYLALTVWFSHSAVFILAGVAAGLIFHCLVNKEAKLLRQLVIINIMWLVSFLVNYYIVLQPATQNSLLAAYWAKTFMPLTFDNFSDLMWFPAAFLNIFTKTLGIYFLPIIAAAMSIIGAIALFFKKRTVFLIFALPVVFTLLASGLHKYPFHGRMLLFLAPCVLFFIAQGIEGIKFKSVKATMIVKIAIIALILIHPFLSASYHFIEPYTRAELKSALAYIENNWQEGDRVYVYGDALPAFSWYKEKYGFNSADYILARDAEEYQESIEEEISNLKGSGRIWVFLLHEWQGGLGKKEIFILANLDRAFERVDSFSAQKIEVHLYGR